MNFLRKNQFFVANFFILLFCAVTCSGQDCAASPENANFNNLAVVTKFDQTTLKDVKDISDGTYYKLMTYKTKTNSHVFVKAFKNKISSDNVRKLHDLSKPPNTYVSTFLGYFEKANNVNLVFDSAPEYITLRDYLRAYKADPEKFKQKYQRKLSKKNLIHYAIWIAKGLQHLVKKERFHPDLSTANILMNGENIKIANYEYPSEFCNAYYLKKSKSGIRRFLWLAPESSTHGKFNEQTIIWSFGVVLWEIFTLGAAPYPGHSSISKYHAFIKKGNRMAKPKLCSNELYEIMKKCWDLNAMNRYENLEKVLIELNKLEKSSTDEAIHISNNIEANDYDVAEGYDDTKLPYF